MWQSMLFRCRVLKNVADDCQMTMTFEEGCQRTLKSQTLNFDEECQSKGLLKVKQWMLKINVKGLLKVKHWILMEECLRTLESQTLTAQWTLVH